ncbi:MAG TPA: hypothetical protein VJH20_06080 [Candidatus Nanoarchaeia archaeon]|nr:hypothetical protein [Candidatus Nanoarchaeia archaeon]
MPYQIYIGYLDISCFDADVTIRSRAVIVSAQDTEDATLKILSLYKGNPTKYLPREVRTSHLTPNFKAAEVIGVKLINPQDLEQKVQ